jgi:hypothetical protein
MRGISWLAAKTGQLLKKDSAPWRRIIIIIIIIKIIGMYIETQTKIVHP